MKQRFIQWASTGAVVLMTMALTACNPDPTENKTAARVQDEVVEEAPEPKPEPDTDTGTDTEAPAEGGEDAGDVVGFVEGGEKEPEGESAEPADAVTYVIDKDSSAITFIGSKPTANHTGGWSEYNGTVTVPGGDFTQAKIDVEIDMTSTYSDDTDLTAKLKGTDFFEVSKFPTSTFKSTEIVQTEDGYDVSGNLNLHGITKNLTFPATVEFDEDSLTAEAEFSFNRKIFEINYDGMADDLIRDNVLMTFYIEAKPE